jgi:hypothetical protein
MRMWLFRAHAILPCSWRSPMLVRTESRRRFCQHSTSRRAFCILMCIGEKHQRWLAHISQVASSTPFLCCSRFSPIAFNLSNTKSSIQLLHILDCPFRRPKVTRSYPTRSPLQIRIRWRTFRTLRKYWISEDSWNGRTQKADDTPEAEQWATMQKVSPLTPLYAYTILPF